MWCRRGNRTSVNKIRKPELSPMSREHKEKQKRRVDSLSPPPSVTNPVFKTEEEPMTSLPTQLIGDGSTQQPEMKAEMAATSPSSPLPASSSVSPPPETSPADICTNSPAGADDSIASTWVGSFYQGVFQIKTLLVKFKNQHKKREPEDLTYRIELVKSFLRYLEFEVEMTPTIKQTYSLDKVLEAVEQDVFRDLVPADIAATCRRLLAMYNEENWGEEQAGMGAYIEAQAASPTMRTSTPAHDTPETANMRLPSPDHPIWGTNGIMHGLALSPATRARMYVVDPRYVHKRKDAKVFGHNGFEPGMWWPYQKLAHFYGVHGAHIQGITGDPKQGAYSIVTSGSSGYDSMDQDFGERLLYSADNSHDNTDPDNIAYTSSRTKSLHKSMETGRPVRVLRSSGGKKAYTPKVGIRYDGLYRVVAVHKVKNKRGGLYEQFELIRLPDQRSLEDIQRNVPSKKQQDDYTKIKNGY